MNSTFKVVFNKARGALMVVNEATSSVQAKGTKTVIAAAVAALMAGGAMAGDLTYDSIVEKEGTFKFLNGKGEVTNIKTNADANKLFSDLSAAGRMSTKSSRRSARSMTLRKRASCLVTRVAAMSWTRQPTL